MPFFTAATIAGIAAAGAGVAGGAIAAHGAGKAASTQAQAAEEAAQLQHQDAQDSLAFQKDEFNTQQSNLQPWLNAGKDSLGQLTGLMKDGGFPAFNEQFQAPTAATEQNDPGYQFRLQQGLNAVQGSAAAKGNLFSGNTQDALTRYGQDYASNEYTNVYNRSMGEFQNRYNIFENNQSNQFNRLAAIAGVGQTAANTLGQEGQAASNNVSNTLLTSGQQIGNQINNAAAARASGYVGSSNAWSGALGGATNNLSTLALLAQMNRGSNPDPYGLQNGNYPQ